MQTESNRAGRGAEEAGELSWRPGLVSEAELDMLYSVVVKVNHQYLPWRGEIALNERERLTFEIDIGTLPLDIYSLTLELERDEVTQGIPVEWNVVRANYKVSTREWQQRMQEEQYAGDCSVTLLYRGLPVPGFSSNIRLQVSRMAEQDYEYMRDILKEQNEQVLYSHRGRTHEISLLAGVRTAAAARYDIVVSYYSRLIRVLPGIMDQPHRTLRRSMAEAPVNTMEALNYNSLKLASHSGAQWRVLPGETRAAEAVIESELLDKGKPAPAAAPPLNSFQAQLLKAHRKLEKAKPPRRPVQTGVRALPTRVPLSRLEESFDTYENRFLKMTIKKLIALSRLVQEQLEQEIATARLEQNRANRSRFQALATRIKTNEGYIENLRRLRSRLEDTLHDTFLEELGPVGPRRASVVLRENRFYRQVRQIETDLENDIELVSSMVGLDSSKNVRVSSINQLYEYWVTVVVLQTMVEKLGFTVVAKEGRPLNTFGKNRFNYILQSGGSLELVSPLGRRVMVHYDREYQSYRGPLRAGYRQSGYAYDDYNDRDTFGSSIYYGYYAPSGMGSTKSKPDIAIEVFGEDERVPKIIILDATYSRDRRTLYTKYEYRDSIRDFTKTDALSGTPARPVVAAWVIYPDEPSRLEHDEFRFGQLPLQPNQYASDQLAGVLRQLLRLAEALD